MSKSLIQTANSSAQTVAANSTIGLGTVLRRFGCNCRLSGNAIEVEGTGYYTVTASITSTPAEVGNVSVAVYNNNVPVAGGTATNSVSTVGNSTNLNIETTVRQGCCCDGADSLTFVLTAGAGVINNISVRVEKA